MKKNGTNNRPAAGDNNMPPEPFLSKGIIRWSLAVLFSGWMFVLGILVGRESAPIIFDTKKLENELITLKKAVMQTEQEQLRSSGKSLLDQQKSDLGLGYPEELKNIKGDKPQTETTETTVPEVQSNVKEEAMIEKTPLKIRKEEPAANLPEKLSLKNKKEDRSERAESPALLKKVEKNEAPLKVSRKPEPPAPKDKEESETDRKLILQIASFRNRNDAEVMVAELVQKGYSAYLSSGEVFGKGTHFRVIVGDFKSGAELQSMKNRLEKDRYNPFMLRSK
jgi:cell division protein FtsN